MRNYSKIVGALAAASALVAGNAVAEIEGEVHVGYANMYQFRFYDYGNDLIESGVDIAYGMGNWGFNAGAWYGSFDATNVNGGSTFRNNNDELDLYAGVNYTWDRFSLEAGYILYYFPDSSSAGLPGIWTNKTQEVYLGATAELWWGFGINSTYYYDFDAGNGWYWDTKLTYSWELNACVSLDMEAGIAYGNGNSRQGNANPWYAGYAGATNNGLQGWYLSAGVPWQVRENLTITPYVRYTDADSGLSTGSNWGDSGQEFLIGGVKVAVSF